MSAVLTPIKNQDYEIADLSLAAWGRKELALPRPKCPA
jgi:S-adenosylhomocysteine hydrolase